MKKLCKVCPEKDYCREPCLESLAEETLDTSGNYDKKKYVARPAPLTSYKNRHKYPGRVLDE